MATDAEIMKRCLVLAEQGRGSVSPNPMVGALIMRDGQLLGEGFHLRSGGPHAEVVAIADAEAKGFEVDGATLFCSLEPCCHTNKRTPPCSELIIQKKIKKIIISNLDPNPHVAGKGVERLRAAGIEVESGLLRQEGEELNRVFFHAITTELPYIHLKMAQTLDGRITSATGDSKWITDEVARTQVHQWRYEYDAVMVGRGTLNADNPGLDIRLCESHGKIPYRIIVGNPSKMNWDLKILADAHTAKTMIIATPCQMKECSSALLDLIRQRQISLIVAPTLKVALEIIATKKITSILVEGGSILASSLIEEKLVNRLSLFIAPKLMGNGPSFYQQQKSFMMNESLRFKRSSWRTFGEQFLFEGEL